MKRAILLLASALALAGCASYDDGSTPTGDQGVGSSGVDGTGGGGAVNQTPPQPESSAMCIEGAEDCVDTVETTMP